MHRPALPQRRHPHREPDHLAAIDGSDDIYWAIVTITDRIRTLAVRLSALERRRVLGAIRLVVQGLLHEVDYLADAEDDDDPLVGVGQEALDGRWCLLREDEERWARR